MLWNNKNLREALNDELIFMDDNYNYEIDNVVFDSRRVNGKSLFIAKQGESSDGHYFIEDVLQNFPDATILANNGFSEKFYNNPRIILVKDTLIAMEKMAIYKRDNTKGKVIGITGSLGKTTTKELLNTCLENYGKTHCNIMSFNNKIGVMTTLCNMKEDTDYAIIEMGMSAKGEMEELSELVQPDITIILNVVLAHSQFFKNEKDIALAKAEILDFQRINGFTVINKNNKYFELFENSAKNHQIKVLTFSETNNADVILKDYEKNNNLYIAKYQINNEIYEFKLSNKDYNIAINLMPILNILHELKLDISKIEHSVENFGTPRGRNNIEEVKFNDKNITIINGTYNAVNPLTFIRGLELIDKIVENKNINRRIAIFGDIREAGDNTNEFMLSLKEYIIKHQIDYFIGIGPMIKILCNSLDGKINVKHFDNVIEAIPFIKSMIENNDLLFIKSSKGIKTYKIINEITNNPMDIFE